MKVKYTKSKSNNCVPRALSLLTGEKEAKLAKTLKMDNKGVRYDTWSNYAKKKGLTVKEMKQPIPVTMGAISDMSKAHKSGMIARISTDQGNHTVFVKKGIVHDDIRKLSKNNFATLHSITYRD